ncbi:MAG: hypothetical protein DLM59_20645 [Pseudonocardiales bacterium]|nr:MAG: hypothetical protein DLM59_20645 [Pseudonocardiales bacterium]
MELAQQLRSLREEHWPGLNLTQAQLGEALGGKGAPLSVALISSWESLTRPRVPPPSRLAAYATLFATDRSVDGQHIRLLDPAKLTDDERASRDELAQRLSTLRTAALAALDARRGTVRADEAVIDTFGSGTWRFADGRPITIVCSALPRPDRGQLPHSDPASPYFVEAYAYAELDALIELYGHIRAVNPLNQVNIRLPDALEPDDYVTHLVLLGGTESNEATKFALDRLDLTVHQILTGDQTRNSYFEVAEGSKARQYRPLVRETSRGTELVEDVGHFFRGVNPFNVKRTVTICNAMFGRGALGVVRALTDSWFRDRNEAYISGRFPDRRTFSILARVPVLTGRTMTPDWTLPHVRLHVWPPPAD